MFVAEINNNNNYCTANDSALHVSAVLFLNLPSNDE
jgi:hypothetical protein